MNFKNHIYIVARDPLRNIRVFLFVINRMKAIHDTLLLFEGIPTALKGGRLRFKDLLLLPSILKRWIFFSLSNLRAEYNWRAISRTLPSNLKLPLISEEVFNLSNLRVLPAKSKCKMPSDFWWKIQVFFPLINIFFFF